MTTEAAKIDSVYIYIPLEFYHGGGHGVIYDSAIRRTDKDDTLTADDGRPFIVELKPHGCTFQDCDGRKNYSPITFEMIGRNDLRNFGRKLD